MYVISWGKKPPRGIGLAGFHQVLFFPCPDIVELLHQLGAVDDIMADGQIGADGEVWHAYMEQ